MFNLIAEIGWNHMGDLELAEKMIIAAKESGATHAKFQNWKLGHGIQMAEEKFIKKLN